MIGYTITLVTFDSVVTTLVMGLKKKKVEGFGKSDVI